MNPRLVERFFAALGRELREPASALLTGGAAAALMGSSRPSADVDFEARPAGRGPRAWAEVARASRRAARLVGVEADPAPDLALWSAVPLLDYRRHSRPHARYGRLTLRVMDPLHWSIGKAARYLDGDVAELAEVFRRRRVPARKVAELWGKVCRRCPRSPAREAFRRQAEHFLSVHGRAAWGESFEPRRALEAFRRAAGPR